MGKESENCKKCTSRVEEDDQGVVCDGPCKSWYHAKCVGISDGDYKKLSKKGVTWYCEECENKSKTRQKSGGRTRTTATPARCSSRSSSESAQGNDIEGKIEAMLTCKLKKLWEELREDHKRCGGRRKKRETTIEWQGRRRTR